MLFILNNKQETIGVASNSNPLSMPYFEDLHSETVDGVNTYEFSVPSDHEDSEKLQNEGHVIVRNLDGEHLLFTIKEVSDGQTDGKRTKHVLCEETAIGELLSDVQRPATYTSFSLEQALKEVLADTMGWTLNKVPYTEAQDVKYEDYTTKLEAIKSVVEQFGMEAYFTVKLHGTKIVEKYLNVVEERGQNTRVRFDYGYDLSGVSRVQDSNNIVTALIGVGKGDSSKARLNLSSLTAFSEGDFYKPDGADWIGSYSALQQYGLNGRHRFGFFVDDDADSQDALKRSTLKELKDRIIPSVTYSCSIVTLERLTGYSAKKLRIGDTILVKDNTFKPAIIITARVKSLKRSYTRNNADSVDLGNYKLVSVSPNKMIKDLQKVISKSETAWNEVPAEVQQQIQDIDNRTGDVQLIQTVVYSQDFTSIMDDKANVEDISDMATGEQLEGVKQSTLQYVDGRLDGEGGINESINKVTSQLEKTANEINAKFGSSGGINLVKNSIGYAGFDFWTLSSGASNGGITVIKNNELEQLGFGAGFKSVDGKAGYMEQVINTNGGGKYSISVWLKKNYDSTSDTWAYVDIFENGVRTARIGKGSGEGTTKGWELGLYSFETEYNEITIRINFGANPDATVSGLMVNKGEVPLQWQHANGEIYNTNVQMNLNGIKVINGETEGYTIMSPEEFSGYAKVLDETNTPVMKRIFTLNGDTTEVMKLDVEEEMTMNSVRILHVDSNGSNGWAFISNA
jgi:phage minor structural protein